MHGNPKDLNMTNNLIDQALKIASYGVGGLNIAEGDSTQGLLLINSQRQISRLEKIDHELEVSNSELNRGFKALDDHFERLEQTNEIGFNKLSQGISEISQDLKAIEGGIAQMGNDMVDAIYAQTIEQRDFQNIVLHDNKLIRDVLDRVLIENEKQTTALENPDQTSSIEKLRTAIKTMKLYDPEFQNSECIHQAINISKEAIEKDPFNEAAIFYCAKWMNILSIDGWKDLYVDAMLKTKLELDNEIESQATLAKENAQRLSIAATIDIIESLDFKLFGEKFYKFSKTYCGEPFLINLEVFYYFYLCSESSEIEANRHLLACFKRFGKTKFYDEIIRNPMALGFEIFWSFLIKEEKDKQWAEELDRTQRADHDQLEREEQVKSELVNAEAARLELAQVVEIKKEINSRINKKITTTQEMINRLEHMAVPADLDSNNLNQREYGTEGFPSIDEFFSIDHEFNIFKWRPSKKKLSNLKLTSVTDDIFQLCLEEVAAADEKLLDMISNEVSWNLELIDVYQQLGEIIDSLQGASEDLSTIQLSSDIRNMKTERKLLKNTLNTLKIILDISSRRNKLVLDNEDLTSEEEMHRPIRSILKQVFPYICILNDILVNSASADIGGKTGLSDEDVLRICEHNIQFSDSNISSYPVLQLFFSSLMFTIASLPNLFSRMNPELLNLSNGRVKKIDDCDPRIFYDALEEYIAYIDKGDSTSLRAIDKVMRLFH